MILQQLRITATEKRDWKPALANLKAAEGKAPDEPEIQLLRTEIVAAQKGIPEAIKSLTLIRDKKPKQLQLWVALVDLAIAGRHWKDGQDVLDRAAKEFGDRAELRLARARLLLRRDKDAVAKVLKLAENRGLLGTEQPSLLRGLAS